MMHCRHCQSAVIHQFIDLGASPPSNAYLTEADLQKPEKWYPLRVMVCHTCWLVQTQDFADAETLFTDEYGYFSSMSASWLDHAKRYVNQMIRRFALDTNSLVIEVASNDGYLLQFVKEAGIPCIGIEPTHNTAASAKTKGIEVVEEFFGVALATQLVDRDQQADLLVANNVLAHVPDINDFVSGFTILLKEDGVATFEFPHLLELVKNKQFDTIYHEHFSYLSLTAVQNIFSKNGLQVFDVERLPSHGGSLRVFAQRIDTGCREVSCRVSECLQQESESGITSLEFYRGFQAAAEKIKNEFLRYLIQAKREGKKVAAYGAAAKGNTLLNFAGIKPDLIQFVVDRSPGKIGRYLPGSRIPIVAEDELHRCEPDVIVILPWNLQHEIKSQLEYSAAWNATFVTTIPELLCVPASSTAEAKEHSYPKNTTTPTRIAYTKPSITELEIRYATDAVTHGWGERCYEYIGRFEEAFKDHLNVKHAIATSSCTGALHMGLAALGIGPGDEVILADINWIATAAPITYLGAKPIFVDILRDTWCLDPHRVEEAITERTRAIIAVHLYGNLCDMKALLEIGQRYGIPVIEDAAEAIGSIYYGKRAGSMGRFGAFSFHGTKTITTGEGGMLVTNDDHLYEVALTLSNHGRSRQQNKQFWPDMVGFKYKMSNVQAAIGCAQVERMNDLVDEKRRIYELYSSRLEGTGLALNPKPDGKSTPGYWMVNAVFPTAQMTADRRELLINALRSINADARVFFWPLSSTGHFETRKVNSIANSLAPRAINLPSAFGMTEQMIDKVCSVVCDFTRDDSAPETSHVG